MVHHHPLGHLQRIQQSCQSRSKYKIELSNSEGQQQNDHNKNPIPPIGIIKTCSKCRNKFYATHESVHEGISYSCPQCVDKRPPSPALSTTSHGSVRSNISQSRRIQLQLQRLEEERTLNAQRLEVERTLNTQRLEKERTLNSEYLNKKYQLLEEAEELAEVLSEKSHSEHNYQSIATNQVDSLEHHAEVSPQVVANSKNINATNHLTSLPETTICIDMATSITSIILQAITITQ